MNLDTTSKIHSSNGLESSLTHNNHNNTVGIIGMGGIGESLLAQLAGSYERLRLSGIYVYSRERDKERVSGVIRQLSPSHPQFSDNIHLVESFEELGKKSKVVVITIGKKEGKNKTKEDLTGQYFRDIKEIMEGIGNNNQSILMATNPVTPNCLVADIYSQSIAPKIIGFTRMDYIRAVHILRNWLKEEKHKSDDLGVDLDILGPHGYGLLATNIRIGSDISRAMPIRDDNGLRLFFEDESKTIKRLSKETADLGEILHRDTLPEGTPHIFAAEILTNLEYLLGIKSGKDTAAINVDLNEMCESGLYMPAGPTYASVPVDYNNGVSSVHSGLDLEIGRIPSNYRKGLLITLRAEEQRIKDYLSSHKKNGFSKLREHFRL